MPNFMMLLIEFSCCCCCSFFSTSTKIFRIVATTLYIEKTKQISNIKNLNHPTINNQHFGQELHSIHIRLSISSVQYNPVKIQKIHISLKHDTWKQKQLTHQQHLNERKNYGLVELKSGIHTCRHHVFGPILFAMSNHPCLCGRWLGIVDLTYTCNFPQLIYVYLGVGSMKPITNILHYVQ